MGAPIELVPLLCVKCDTAVPAQPEEAAWVCAQCGQAMLLDDQKGLVPLQVHYAAGIPPNTLGRPFWVAQGKVDLQRELFKGNKNTEAQSLWSQPRRFTIPAYTCTLQMLLENGPQYLLKPPSLNPGPAVRFQPVTLAPRDLLALAEFIVVAIEAERSDMLKQVQVSVALSEPALWILP